MTFDLQISFHRMISILQDLPPATALMFHSKDDFGCQSHSMCVARMRVCLLAPLCTVAIICTRTTRRSCCLHSGEAAVACWLVSRSRSRKTYRLGVSFKKVILISKSHSIWHGLHECSCVCTAACVYTMRWSKRITTR